MSAEHPDITPGSRWLNSDNNRVIVIIESEVHGTGPSWRYEDGGNPGQVNWYYCQACDFTLWGRFKLLTAGKSA